MKPRLTRAQRAAYEALQNGSWKTMSAREQARLARTLSDLSVRGWSAVKPDVYVNRVPTAENPDFNPRLQGLLQQVHKHLGRKAHLLDLGAGHGRDATWFQQQGLAVSLLEPSANFFTYLGGEVAAGRLLPQHLMRADARNIPVAENRFDAVLAMAMLQHLPLMPGTGLGADAVIAEVARVLRPNGLLLVSVMEAEGCDISPITAVPDKNIFWQWYRPQDMVDLLARHGFTVVEDSFTPDLSHKFVADKRPGHKPWISFVAKLSK